MCMEQSDEGTKRLVSNLNRSCSAVPESESRVIIHDAVTIQPERFARIEVLMGCLKVRMAVVLSY